MRINPCALLLWVVMTPLTLGYGQEPPMPGVANPKSPGPIKPAQEPKTPSVDATSLEELMLEKGLITQDDYIRLKAEQERRTSETATMAEFTASPRWYERLRHYGYGQLRYNQLGNPNGQVRTYHDASVGDASNGAQPGFFYRRIRWVITGQVSEHVGIFFQPDMASNISGNTHALSFATPGENGISIRRKNSAFEPVSSAFLRPGTTGRLPASAWQSIVRMPPTRARRANATSVSRFNGRQSSPNSGGST